MAGTTHKCFSSLVFSYSSPIPLLSKSPDSGYFLEQHTEYKKPLR